jgi:hypothetical protein
MAYGKVSVVFEFPWFIFYTSIVFGILNATWGIWE